jgi:CTP synthase
VKSKIALFCNVEEEAVISAKDVETVYELPLVLHREGLDEGIVQRLNIWTGRPSLERWEGIVSTLKNPRAKVRIGMVGKYVELTESYKSLNEALVHGGLPFGAGVEIEYIDSEKLEGGALHALSTVDGVLVPHGFGPRGAEGKIQAARFAREGGIPYLGICFGMQCAVIEVARSLAKLERASSTEIDPKTPHPVIDLLPEQRGRLGTGGTMRLGAYDCRIAPGTRAEAAYGVREVMERHRHRYELNLEYRPRLEGAGLVVSGTSPDGRLVEIVELRDHPWFLACQFHPEFKSTPFAPHPLFREFVRAALEHRQSSAPSSPSR